MKDCLFEMLMDFFEETLVEIKEKKVPLESKNSEPKHPRLVSEMSTEIAQILGQRQANSIRIFTPEEQFKLTKASHQFIVRLMRLELFTHETIEEILHQLLFSDYAFVTLQETKAVIRNTLAPRLSLKQLAFLDLVLSQKEDQFALH